MKYLYMSFLLALVYSCSDSGDNSDYSEMLKKDFNQEIKWDVDSLAFAFAAIAANRQKTNKRFLIIISQLNDYSKATGVSGTKRMLASPISKLTIFTQAH